MTDKQPTQEQIKELWEWCGFGQFSYRMPLCNHTPRCKGWRDPSRQVCFKPPEIDLNNLFEYAVPKLRELKYYIVLRDIGKGFHCSLVYTTAEKKSYYGESNNPALALFWAIWEVIHG